MSRVCRGQNWHMFLHDSVEGKLNSLHSRAEEAFATVDIRDKKMATAPMSTECGSLGIDPALLSFCLSKARPTRNI